MIATNNIKELFFSKDLLARTCRECDQHFNDKDYKNDNWNIEYIASSNIDFSLFRKNTSKGAISVIITLQHLDCHEKKPERKPRQDFTISDYPN